jgi:hypothetical protein
LSPNASNRSLLALDGTDPEEDRNHFFWAFEPFAANIHYGTERRDFWKMFRAALRAAGTPSRELPAIGEVVKLAQKPIRDDDARALLAIDSEPQRVGVDFYLLPPEKISQDDFLALLAMERVRDLRLENLNHYQAACYVTVLTACGRAAEGLETYARWLPLEAEGTRRLPKWQRDTSIAPPSLKKVKRDAGKEGRWKKHRVAVLTRQVLDQAMKTVTHALVVRTFARR